MRYISGYAKLQKGKFHLKEYTTERHSSYNAHSVCDENTVLGIYKGEFVEILRFKRKESTK